MTRSPSKCLLMIALAFLGLIGFGWQARADKVVLQLRNGDRISGVLVSQTETQTVITSPVFGTLVTPAEEITRFERFADNSDPPPSVIPPRSGATATNPKPGGASSAASSTPTTASKATNATASTATANTSTNAAKALAANGATNSTAKLSTNSIVASTKIATNAPSWWKPYVTNWHGTVQLGLDLGFGTHNREFFSGQVNAGYVGTRFRHNVSYSTAFGQIDQTLSANRMEGSFKTDFDLLKGKNHLYLYNLGVAGYDELQKLDFRYQEGAGLGYMILNKQKFLSKQDALVMNIELGGLYQENFYSTGINKDSVSVRAGQDATWKLTQRLLLTERLQFIPNVEDMSDYRARVDFSLSYPLTTVLTLNLNVVDEYQSKPPLTVKGNDLQIRSTLGFRF